MEWLIMRGIRVDCHAHGGDKNSQSGPKGLLAFLTD
jgi:hypothetical protein